MDMGMMFQLCVSIFNFLTDQDVDRQVVFSKKRGANGSRRSGSRGSPIPSFEAALNPEPRITTLGATCQNSAGTGLGRLTSISHQTPSSLLVISRDWRKGSLSYIAQDYIGVFQLLSMIAVSGIKRADFFCWIMQAALLCHTSGSSPSC